MGLDQSAARYASAFDREPVGPGARRDAINGKTRFDGGEAITLLHPQFIETLHMGDAFRKGGGHREDRIFIDHRGRALRRHLDALEARGMDPEIAHFLAAGEPALLDRDIAAHLDERCDEAGARLVQHHILD